MIDRIHVIGSGRVGSAVAARLSEQGIAVRSGRVVEGDPQLVLLCVPDAAIRDVAQGLTPGPLVAHMSGATPLGALDPHAAGSASIRCRPSPPRGPEQLDGAWAAVTAETTRRAAGIWLAETLAAAVRARRLGAHALPRGAVCLELPRHAAPCGVCSSRARAPPEALEPLMRRTIENDFELTGPISRGDWATVEAHRAAIRATHPELDELYETLAGGTLALAT